jgi:hypothetical protein
MLEIHFRKSIREDAFDDRPLDRCAELRRVSLRGELISLPQVTCDLLRPVPRILIDDPATNLSPALPVARRAARRARRRPFCRIVMRYF